MNDTVRSQRFDEYVARPRRALWVMALPVMAGMSIHTFYMIADMIFVGRLGPEALAAVSFNMPLVFLGIGVTFGLGSGVTAVIAHAIGAQDKVGADRSAEHAVGLGAFVAILFTVAGFLWGRGLLTTLGAPPELLDQAWEYCQIMVAGFSFLVMSVFFRSILSGEGDVRVPMMIQGGGTLLNVILDPLLIFGLDLGIRGAALATVISQGAAAAAFVYLLFFKEHSYVTFDLRHFRFSSAILGGIFRIGAPASFSFLLLAIGGAVFNRILVTYSGNAVAAYQVGGRVDHVVLLPLIAISASLLTLVGMFHGAQREELVRELVSYALRCSVGIAVALGLLFFAIAPQFVAMFSQNEEIREIGTAYVRIGVLGYPFIALAMPIGRALQGLGLGVPMFVLTLLRTLLISAPLAAFCVYRLDKPIEWVWGSMVIGVALSAGLAVLWLRWGLARAEKGGLVVAQPAEQPLASPS